MHLKNISVILFLPLFIISCAHLTKGGAKVLLVEGAANKIPSNCKFITSISENGFDENLGLAHTEARFDLRNLAARKGANVVKVTSESQSFFPRGWLISGDAYYCSANISKASPTLTREEKCKQKDGVLSDNKCVIEI
jgi:hypothetical protein